MSSRGMSAREKNLSSKTLVCLLQSLEGREENVTVELRDETSVAGKVVSVDGYMNVEMKDCIYTAPSGERIHINHHMCQGKYIRYVSIPSEVDPIEAMEEQLQILSQPIIRRGRGGRGRGGRGGGGRGFRGGGGRGGGRFSQHSGGGGGGSSSRYGGDHRSSSSYRSGGSHAGSSSSYHGGGSYGGSSSHYDRSRY